MRKQLIMFAGLGMATIAMFVLGTLFVQFAPMFVRKCVESLSLDIKPHLLSLNELELLDEKIDLVYHYSHYLIVVLAYWLLDFAYNIISRQKATRTCALWGMAGSRLALVCISIGMARVILLKRHGINLDSVAVLEGVFRSVSFCVLGCSVLMLGKSVLENLFLRELCVIGAFGWFYGSIEELLWVFPSSRVGMIKYMSRNLTPYCGIWYVTEACRLLPFVGVLVGARPSLDFTGADEDLNGRTNEGYRLGEMGGKCATALFWLAFVAIPLCFVSAFSKIPSFTKQMFFISSRQNTFLFKLFCVSLGGIIAIRSFTVILPHLNSADLGRVFAHWLEKLANAVSAVKRVFSFGQHASPAPEPEKSSTPRARDRLVELKQLLDEGLISQAEFEQKRASILAEM